MNFTGKVLEDASYSLSSTIDIPIEPSTLPSRGFTYPNNIEISYRPYILGELYKISQIPKDTTTALNIRRVDIILSGIFVKGMSKEMLTLADFNYLSVLRQISTLGDDSELTLTWKCPKCGKTHNRTVNLTTQIEFKDLEVKLIEADINSQTLTFTPLTVKGYKTKLALSDKYETDVSVMALQVDTEEPFGNIYNFLYNLSDKEDIEAINEIDRHLYHDVNPVEAVCKTKECGHTSLIPFKNIREYITSKSVSDGADKSKIRLIK
ncbi:hypothetical protein ThvES_00008170 [Thiovulum sp. ES]|nr:hypothetical protein ThvES_00008170 [Thiovulum sp. ES]